MTQNRVAELRSAAAGGGYCAAQAQALGRIDGIARPARYDDRDAAARLADIVAVLAALDVVRAERTRT